MDPYGSLSSSVVKRPCAMQDTQVRFLGGEDAVEEGMATYCSILVWRVPGIEEPGGGTAPGVAQSRTRASTRSWYGNKRVLWAACLGLFRSSSPETLYPCRIASSDDPPYGCPAVCLHCSISRPGSSDSRASDRTPPLTAALQT